MKRKFLMLVCLMIGAPIVFIFINGCIRKCAVTNTCTATYALGIGLIDNGGLQPQDPAANEVFAKALIIHITQKDSATKNKYCFQDPFTTSAFAGLKRCGELVYLSPDSFSITSNQPFDATHPANTDLKDLMYKERAPNKDGDYYFLRSDPDKELVHKFKAQMIYYSNNDTTIIEAFANDIKLLKQ